GLARVAPVCNKLTPGTDWRVVPRDARFRRSSRSGKRVVTEVLVGRTGLGAVTITLSRVPSHDGLSAVWARNPGMAITTDITAATPGNKSTFIECWVCKFPLQRAAKIPRQGV